MNRPPRAVGENGRWWTGGRRVLERRIAVALLLWLSVFPGAWPAAGSPWKNDAERAQLERGEIPVQLRDSGEVHRGWVAAAVLIEAPAEEIWETMTDCPSAPAFVPGLQACRVVSAGENWEIIRHDIKWIWFLPRVSYEFRADYDPPRRLQFKRTRGALREMRGTWELFPLTEGRGTIVRYAVYLDPGFFIPQLIVQRSLKKDLPAVLKALRTEVAARRSPR